ncbi:MAG: hypothetical protein VB137_12055 [Burkholderia sp.]
MKKALLCLAVLASQSALADPLSGAGWTLTCHDQTPTVTTTYSMSGDAGLPGLLYVALKLPGTNLPQAPLFQNPNAGWESFTGGLAPVRTIYRTALPASDTIKVSRCAATKTIGMQKRSLAVM